jgi:CheY-like chemotaxis protein
MPHLQTAPETHSAKIELLIVDDEAATRDTLTEIFTQLGYRVRNAQHGFAALAAIRQQAPDILLSDLNMPQMSGFELLSIVRRRYPQMYVVAMSGAYSGKLVPQAILADAFYEKASDAGALFQMVAEVGRTQRSDPAMTGESAPVWVPSNGHNHAGQPYVTLACPDCMRTFEQVIGATGCLVQRATCHHCWSAMHFAVVSKAGIPLPQPPVETSQPVQMHG